MSSTANFPLNADGSVYHVGVKRGDLSNYIVSVGSHARARLIASFMSDVVSKESSRGFHCHTGLYSGVRISVIAIGMGFAMMDFMVREVRAMIDGPLYIVRLGTCGTPSAALGTCLVAARGSVGVLRNFDAFAGAEAEIPKYRITHVAPSDGPLSLALLRALRARALPTVAGVNASADSFYASQGRKTPHFDDGNEGLIERLLQEQPELVSLEMETFQLLHLAQCARPEFPIRATAAAIAIAQRQTDEFLDKAKILELEEQAGRAVLDCFVRIDEAMEGVDV